MNPEILRYITDNRDTYTREAITRQLIARGHDPAEIEQAWESIEPTFSGGLPRDRTFWRYFTVYVVVLYGLTFVVYALDFGGESIILVLGVFLLLGAGTSILLVRANRAVAKGAASGLLIAALVPFMFLVIIAGICSSLIGGYPFADQDGLWSTPVTYRLRLYGQAPEGQALVVHESSTPLDEETGYAILPVCGDPAALPGETVKPCPNVGAIGGDSISIEGATSDESMIYFRFVAIDAAHPDGTAFYQGEGSQLLYVVAWYDFRTGKGGSGSGP